MLVVARLFPFLSENSFSPCPFSQKVTTEITPMKALETESYVQSKVPPGFIPFSLGQPDKALLPSLAVAKALENVSREVTEQPFALQYGKQAGPDHFREQLAYFIERQHQLCSGTVDPGALAMTPGNSA